VTFCGKSCIIGLGWFGIEKRIRIHPQKTRAKSGRFPLLAIKQTNSDIADILEKTRYV
jgi:hypothetical protein